MKRNKMKTPALYYVIAFILIGILAFAGYQALRIYLPQSKESRDFASVKEEAGIKDISAQDIIDASASADPDSPDDQSGGSGSEITDIAPVRRLAELNSDFVGWLSIEDTDIDYPAVGRTLYPDRQLRSGGGDLRLRLRRYRYDDV